MPLCNSHTEITSVEIDDIIESTDMGIRVIITKTGKPCWLPAQYIDFMPGRVIVPVRLAKKIWGNNDKGRATSK